MSSSGNCGPDSLHVPRKVELGVVIGKGGRDITEQQADSHVAGYGARVWLNLASKYWS